MDIVVGRSGRYYVRVSVANGLFDFVESLRRVVEVLCEGEGTRERRCCLGSNNCEPLLNVEIRAKLEEFEVVVEYFLGKRERRDIDDVQLAGSILGRSAEDPAQLSVLLLDEFWHGNLLPVTPAVRRNVDLVPLALSHLLLLERINEAGLRELEILQLLVEPLEELLPEAPPKLKNPEVALYEFGRAPLLEPLLVPLPLQIPARVALDNHRRP